MNVVVLFCGSLIARLRTVDAWFRWAYVLQTVLTLSAKFTSGVDATNVRRHVLADAFMAAALAHEDAHVCRCSRDGVVARSCLLSYWVSQRLELSCEVEAFLSNQGVIDLLVLQSKQLRRFVDRELRGSKVFLLLL